MPVWWVRPPVEREVVVHQDDLLTSIVVEQPLASLPQVPDLRRQREDAIVVLARQLVLVVLHPQLDTVGDRLRQVSQRLLVAYPPKSCYDESHVSPSSCLKYLMVLLMPRW